MAYRGCRRNPARIERGLFFPVPAPRITVQIPRRAGRLRAVPLPRLCWNLRALSRRRVLYRIMAKRVGVDKWMFFTTLLLVVAGLVMVFSASAVVAQERY